jgi:hypothetical protein
MYSQNLARAGRDSPNKPPHCEGIPVCTEAPRFPLVTVGCLPEGYITRPTSITLYPRLEALVPPAAQSGIHSAEAAQSGIDSAELGAAAAGVPCVPTLEKPKEVAPRRCRKRHYGQQAQKGQKALQ